MHRVAFEDPGQLLEIDRQLAEHRSGDLAERRRQPVCEVVVAVPAPLLELGHTARGPPFDAANILVQCGKKPVTDQLESVTGKPVIPHRGRHRSTVTLIDSRSSC